MYAYTDTDTQTHTWFRNTFEHKHKQGTEALFDARTQAVASLGV
jgi:hypothetical protein